ncbi:LysE/ArgO family amino acid transporter [Fictibacillus sp. KU28468]|uniref:LysE/ArgO family amino acid transporter n=1 Tax=Fictibacillus sp. KU28468 TaxID=2991053 RepID=UPI00223CB3F3|nr:LysE family transporter [Fictibacillus sp. KU28468]UZJ77598.1 LysE family transporter [Fictibacillus sp. KU28468]
MQPIIHGFLLALGLILPLGVQNVFVFNQGANQKQFKKALPVIITASICDTVLILLAVFGVSLLILSFSWLKMILFMGGFFFLLFMGWSVWRSKPSKSSEAAALPMKKQVTFAASVSLLNPHALLDTAGVIGTSSIVYSGAEKLGFTMACISVSWLWFIGLAFAGKWIGERDGNGKRLLFINRLSAFLIWGVALYIAKEIIKLL